MGATGVGDLGGAFAFGSYFYFLGTGGFVEPLHTLVVAVLFPCWCSRCGADPLRRPGHRSSKDPSRCAVARCGVNC